MKFSLSWLRDHIDTKADLETITNTLTNIGLEVETVEDKEKEYTIARVIEAGYKIDSDGKPEMIRHAKVEVYVPK